VARFVAEMADLLRGLLGPEIRLEIAIPEGLCPLMIDPSQLELAILNIASNARDAMPEGGALRIRARNVPDESLGGGGRIAIICEDTGTGIPPDALDSVFEPFFTTKERGKGTGLGLSQVYGFARQSGGDVTVESSPGSGTTVTLSFPILDD